MTHARWNLGWLGRGLSIAGPAFGLLSVLVLFAILLAWKDVSDYRKAAGLQGAGSWGSAIRETPYDGLKAFASVRNFKTVLAQTVIVGIGALGMTMIIVSGGIDLSAGSSVALTSVLGATLLVKGCSSATVVLLVILTGGLIGLVNGGLVAWLRMMPFIVTLGMMGVCRGAAKWIGDNQTVSAPEHAPLLGLMHVSEMDRLLPLHPGVWLAAALTVLLAIVMQRTVFGRHVFAIGSNEATARLCGVRVQRQKVFIYGAGGLFFGCSGLMQLTRIAQGDPSGAMGLELDIIAAVVIGGASLSGGTGSIPGSLVGALVIQFLRNGSSIMLWPTFVQEIIIGVVIILAVGLDRWRQVKSATMGS